MKKRITIYILATMILFCSVMITSAAQTTSLQNERAAFIQKLINLNVFYKVEIPAKYPYLWINTAFHYLNFEQKSKFVSVVYMYYMTQDPKYDMVVLIDNRNNKDIGHFNKHGLHLD